MIARPVRLAIATGVAAALCFLGAWSPASAMTVPTLELRTSDGAIMRLADLRGRVVLIDFWASWCPPCKASFPALDALYRDLHKSGLEVLAVNVDERPRDADAFLAAHPHTMPVLLDPKGAAATAFNIRGMPSSVILDRAGDIRFTHMGYTERTLESMRRELSTLLSERTR